jgi:isocitrate dehydrogenase
MSNKISIAVAQGDGIGPEIMKAVLRIFDAAQVPLDYVFVEMGKSLFDRGLSTGMTPEAKQSVEALGVLFKGPMETPKGKGVKSINVTARKVWNTYANNRDFKSLPGVETVFSKAGIPIDITIVRENIEDTYGGIEHLLTHDVALCRRFITRPGSLQVHRYAFEMARKKGARRITCAHKSNIMKLTDGLFLETFYEVAKEYPEIPADDIIIDDLAMKLVSRPQLFDVVVIPNLQGDIISDLCAGLVGGLGFAPSANIGDHISIFEAVHGTAPDIAGQDKANPTALLLSGLIMLRHLGFGVAAARIENALRYTLEQGIRTGDFGDSSISPLGTQAFADVVIANLGKVPNTQPVNEQTAATTAQERLPRPAQVKVMVSPKTAEETINGADLFLESTAQPRELGALLEEALGGRYRLTTISNRGTQVWPEGSIFTECVNQYRARIERHPDQSVTAQEMLELARSLSDKVKICSVEMLAQFGDKKGYSLAQGQ